MKPNVFSHAEFEPRFIHISDKPNVLDRADDNAAILIVMFIMNTYTAECDNLQQDSLHTRQQNTWSTNVLNK